MVIVGVCTPKFCLEKGALILTMWRRINGSYLSLATLLIEGSVVDKSGPEGLTVASGGLPCVGCHVRERSGKLIRSNFAA